MALTVLKQYAPTSPTKLPTIWIPLTSLIGAAGTVTAIVASTTGMATGDVVTIAGSSIAGFNGEFTITVVNGTTFTYAQASTGTALVPASIIGTDVTISGSPFNITALIGDGTVATATVASTSALTTGDLIEIAYANDFDLLGTHTINVISPTKFQFHSTYSGTAAPKITVRDNVIANAGTMIWGSQGRVLVGGPRLSTDTTNGNAGYSLDPMVAPGKTAMTLKYDMSGYSNAIRGLFAFSQFMYFNKDNHANSGSNLADFIRIFWASSYDVLFLVSGDYASTGNFVYSSASVGNTDTGVSIPQNKWIELRVAMQCNNIGTNTNWNVYLAYRVCGQSSWTNIVTLTSTTINGAGQLPVGVAWGVPAYNSGGGLPVTYARVGMPTLLQLGTYADKDALLSTLATPVVDPLNPSGGTNWYWDPVNALGVSVDSNAGNSSDNAFYSKEKILEMAMNNGFFYKGISSAWQTAVGGVATGTDADMTQDANVLLKKYLAGQIALTGDNLIINNNGQQEMRLGVGVLIFPTYGLTIKSSGGVTAPANLTQFIKLLPTAWTLTSAMTYTFQQPSQGFNSVLYENRKPMIIQTSIAAVEAEIGSFYNDGTNFYVNPGFVDPTVNGNVYECTGCTSAEGSGIYTGGKHGVVQGINISGMTTVPSGGLLTGGFAFRNVGTSSEFRVWDTCVARHWSKHGWSNGSLTLNNARYGYYNCVAEGGNPYSGFGSHSAYVDQPTNSGSSGNQASYIGCSTGRGLAQIVGSDLFEPNFNYITYITHGPTNTFVIDFNDCDFSRGGVFSIQSSNVTTFNGCKLNDWGMESDSICNRCLIISPPSNPIGTFNSCIVILTAQKNVGASSSVAIFTNCTFDYTKLTSTIPFVRTAALNWTLNQCLLLAGSVAFVSGIQVGDTYLSSYCEIQSPSSQAYLAAFKAAGSLTLAGAVTNGADSQSVTTTAVGFEAFTYKRTSQSAVIRAVGNVNDYSGVKFNQRKTVGAFEFVGSDGASAVAGSGGGAGAFGGGPFN